MPRAGVTHDITIRSYDRTVHHGFMLTRDRSGTRAFRRRDAQTIRPRILSMGELTHAELPPELELTWFQEDWSLGIGGVTDRLDPKKLSMTNKMDSSVQGVLRPARKATLTAIQSGETPDNYRPSGFAVVPMTTAASAINYDLWMFLGRDVYKWATSSDDWSRETEPLAADVYYKNALIFGTYAIAPGGYAGSDLTDCAAPYIYKNATDTNWTSSTITAGRFRYMAVGRNSSGDEVLWGGNHIFKTARTAGEAVDNSETTITLDNAASGHIAVNDIILMSGITEGQETMLVTGVSGSDITVVRGYGSSAITHDSGAIISLYQPHVIKSSADASNTGSWSTAVTIGTDDAPITGLVFDRLSGQFADDLGQAVGLDRPGPKTVLIVRPVVAIKTGRVPEQVAVCDRPGQRLGFAVARFDAHLGQLRQRIRHRVVQLERAAIKQDHRRDAGDRFAHRPNWENRVVGDRPVVRQPGLGGAVVNHPAVAGDDRSVGCGEFIRDELLLHGEHGIELG